MLAILVVMGTKYACNLDHVGDQICLQSQSRRGPYMPAIVSVEDHICLQSRIFLNSFLTQDDHFQGVLKIFEIAGIYGPYRNGYRSSPDTMPATAAWLKP